MTKKTSPFKLDYYRSRSGRLQYISEPDNIYAKAWFSNLAVIAFVFIDLFCLKVVWNLVQTEDPLYVWCVAFACAAALDVPLAISAIAEKKYRQGLCSEQERDLIMGLSITVFAIAFIFSFGFRVLTRDLSFDIGTGSTITNTLAAASEEDTGNSEIMFAALFNGVIPLLTSISSFVISYSGYNPVDMKLARLERERIGLQANILEGEKALAEIETAEEHCKGLIAREGDLFIEFMNQLASEAFALKQMVRVLMMKKLGTPEGVTAMSKAGAELAQSYTPDYTPGQKLPEFVETQLNKKETVITKLVNHAA